jgi:hypothetical protein
MKSEYEKMPDDMKREQAWLYSRSARLSGFPPDSWRLRQIDFNAKCRELGLLTQIVGA